MARGGAPGGRKTASDTVPRFPSWMFQRFRLRRVMLDDPRRFAVSKCRCRSLQCMLLWLALAWAPCLSSIARAQDDVAGIPQQDLRAAGDENKRYFLIGPRDRTRPPIEGFKLL